MGEAFCVCGEGAFTASHGYGVQGIGCLGLAMNVRREAVSAWGPSSPAPPRAHLCRKGKKAGSQSGRCLGTRRDPLASTFPGYVPGSQAWWLGWVPHFVCIKSP